jgi:hypothetical protein
MDRTRVFMLEGYNLDNGEELKIISKYLNLYKIN